MILSQRTINTKKISSNNLLTNLKYTVTHKTVRAVQFDRNMFLPFVIRSAPKRNQSVIQSAHLTNNFNNTDHWDQIKYQLGVLTNCGTTVQKPPG